jgi:hypothetical protein
VSSAKWDCGDKVTVSLVADGSCLPPFIAIRENSLPRAVDFPNVKFYRIGQDGNSGVDMVLAYLGWIWNKGWLSEGDLVLLDRSNCHTSAVIKEWFESRNVEYEFFPASTGALLSPVDNSFNANFKQYFARLNTYTPPDSRKQKLKHIIDAYYEVKDSSIRKWFKSCGILGGNVPQTIERLMKAGFRVAEERKLEHQCHHDMYLRWKSEQEREYSDDSDEE